MRRRLPRILAALVLALIPAALGTVTAVLYSGSGTRLLGKMASTELSRLFRGSFTVHRISGSFLRGIVIDSLQIRDTLGEPFADVGRLRARYILPNLLAGRIVLNEVELDNASVRIVKRKDGRMNLHEIFRLGEGPPGTGRSPLIEFRNIRLRHATLEARLPWNPPDTSTTPEQVAAALDAERGRPGRIVLETPDGFRRVVTLANLNAKLPVLRVSSPDGAPLTFDVDSLNTHISDPAITVVDLAAHAWTKGDSLAFTLHHATLPGTSAKGGGVITWPEGPVLYDFAVTASRFDLRDFHWISPVFPDMTGHATVTAKSRSRRLTAYTFHDLQAAGDLGRVEGDVTVLTDSRRGLGVENMALSLTDLDLDVPRAYLDTVPLQGTLTGTVEGSGFLDGLDIGTDVTFHDRLVPGRADNQIQAQGHLAFGGAEGTLFDTLTLRHADFDLRTVALQAPVVKLHGRMQLEGTLTGPWKNLTFTGAMRHQDGDLPESKATGYARLDTRRDTVRFDTRMDLERLAFAGVRPGYPDIPLQGAVEGTVELSGKPDSFYTMAVVTGELGTVVLQGVLHPGDGRLGADSLVARFGRLDLARVRGSGPHTVLTGRLAANGVLDTAAGPAGGLELDLTRSSAKGITIDSLHAALRGDSGRVVLDTALATWAAGRVGGRGAVGWKHRIDDHILLTFVADSLRAFDSLLTSYTESATDSTGPAAGLAKLDTLVNRINGPPVDTIGEPAPLSGKAHGEVELVGSMQAPRVLVRARAEDLGWRGITTPALSMGFGWNGAGRPEVGLAVNADTVLLGRVEVRDLDFAAGGFQDSLRWSGTARLGGATGISGAGAYWTTGPDPVVSFDSLLASLPSRGWRLRQPATVVLNNGRYDLTGVNLGATDGSGSVILDGAIPRSGPANLTISVLGLQLRDVYTMLQMDTTGVSGSLQLDLGVGGTAALPTLRGTMTVADLSFGDFGSPFVQGVLDYADRRLDANLLLWKTGQNVLRVEAKLPLDLALKSVRRRQVDGPLSIRAIADSTDLAVAEAFTRSIRRVRGMLKADVEVGGSWDNPRLAGFIELQNASAQLPGLGVSWERANLRARLSGDSITLDSLVMRSGQGSLRATGGLRVEQLTRPVFDLRLASRRFRVIDDRRFLTLDASGDVRLTGMIFRPHLTGQVTADEGTLHFADLITKRIVDLENPGDSGLIDLNLVRNERLGANFQNRFLDSLTIDNLRLQMGESFWLRSSEANIQLDGSLTIEKRRAQYRYDGTLNAVRGNYALRIGGFVTKDFTVERGTVRYFGTPDLNADLDIEARHVVLAAESGEEIPVIARITGTMLRPRLELQSAPTANRPSLSQTELVSYLMFGRPTFSLQGTNGQGSQYAAVQAGLSYLSSALSSEIQRSLISDLGVPIDYLDIKTGGAGAGLAGQTGAAQVATVAAGWQIGRRWFVSVVADLCTNTQRFYPNAEFRMSRQVRLKTAVEPAYSCQVALNQPALSVNKYQVGLDLLWDREY
jgi:translocation and assembly module TamB